MKNILRIRYFLIVFILLSSNSRLQAQYITLPDGSFSVWLQQHGFASCFNGYDLDTTCALLQIAHKLEIHRVSIMDLGGLEYFVNLDTLTFDSNYVSPLHVGKLPPRLKYVRFQYCHDLNIDTFPPGINELEMFYNHHV